MYHLSIHAQDISPLQGALVTRTKVFVKDSSINAVGTPQYEDQIFSNESWLDLSYQRYGFEIGARFDLFLNSNLINPDGSYSANGIGKWYLHKSIGNIDLKGGYIYDQIGKGFLYRSFEDRDLGIDNALIGVSVATDFFEEKLQLKAFAGDQKYLLDKAGVAIVGMEASYELINADNTFMTPGFGFVVRNNPENDVKLIFSDNGFNDVVENNYAASVFNTLSYGPIDMYVEAAYSAASPKVYANYLVNRNLDVQEAYIHDSGALLYAQIAMLKKKYGVTLQGKWVDNFQQRVNPLDINLQSNYNFLAPINKVNTNPLTGFYPPNAIEYQEQSINIDGYASINTTTKLLVDVSIIDDHESTVLYRELQLALQKKIKKQYDYTIGAQAVRYNQGIYQEPELGLIDVIVPFVEYNKYYTNKTSLHLESQALFTQYDLGNWVNVAASYNFPSNWQIDVSSLTNLGFSGDSPIFYYSALGSYSHKSTLISGGYERNREGIVCSGGICRFQPAFNGFVLNMSTNF